MENKEINELCEYALGIKSIPDGRIFWKSEVEQLINYKTEELKKIMEDELEELRDSIRKTTDERVDKNCSEVLLEYIDIIEEKIDFPSYANL